MKLMKKKMKKSTEGICREIWCSYRETEKFNETLVDSRKTGRVGSYACGACLRENEHLFRCRA